MATGYTQAELDALLAVMDKAVPPLPSKLDKIEAARVTALRIAITDKGALLNIETKGGDTGFYWCNVGVAKELAGAISVCSSEFHWSKRGLKPEPSDHIREPERADLGSAADIRSLATYGEPSGILVRFAIDNPVKHRSLFFPRTAALEVMMGLGNGGTIAQWWTEEDFELIPSHESQN